MCIYEPPEASLSSPFLLFVFSIPVGAHGRLDWFVLGSFFLPHFILQSRKIVHISMTWCKTAVTPVQAMELLQSCTKPLMIMHNSLPQQPSAMQVGCGPCTKSWLWIIADIPDWLIDSDGQRHHVSGDMMPRRTVDCTYVVIKMPQIETCFHIWCILIAIKRGMPNSW